MFLSFVKVIYKLNTLGLCCKSNVSILVTNYWLEQSICINSIAMLKCQSYRLKAEGVKLVTITQSCYEAFKNDRGKQVLHFWEDSQSR